MRNPKGWGIPRCGSLSARVTSRLGTSLAESKKKLGRFRIPLAQEKIEVAALIGLQYGILK